MYVGTRLHRTQFLARGLPHIQYSYFCKGTAIWGYVLTFFHCLRKVSIFFMFTWPNFFTVWGRHFLYENRVCILYQKRRFATNRWSYMTVRSSELSVARYCSFNLIFPHSPVKKVIYYNTEISSLYYAILQHFNSIGVYFSQSLRIEQFVRNSGMLNITHQFWHA